MPYKCRKKKIPKELDARRKLSNENKEQIKSLGRQLSQRALAKLFGVSRRTIQFILDPEKLKRNKELYKERGGSMHYYTKEKHKNYIKKHRRRKHELDKQGKLID
jgi:transposase